MVKIKLCNKKMNKPVNNTKKGLLAVGNVAVDVDNSKRQPRIKHHLTWSQKQTQCK